MLKPEHIALELLEYKVDDLLLRRKPRGGAASAWSLCAYLEQGAVVLDPEEQRRFEEVSKTLHRVSQAPASAKRVVDSLELLELGNLFETPETSHPDIDAKRLPDAPLTPAERAEQGVLRRLALRVWWYDFEAVLQRLAALYKAERGRFTARLLYATLRNLHHYREHEGFAQDPGLNRVAVDIAVPEVSDPLLTFSDVDSISELIRELVETALTLTQPGSPYAALGLPEAQALSYLRRAALKVALDPYAGRLSTLPSREVSSQQLRVALQELIREPVREDVKAEQRVRLEERLKHAVAFERQQRQLFEHDVETFTTAMNALFEQLEAHLPQRVGGRARDPQLPNAVLFGENPALRLTRVGPELRALTVHLKGPVRLSLAGIELSLSGSGSHWTIFVGSAERPLKTRHAFKLGQRRLLVFREGRYVHLRVQEDTTTLTTVLAEAWAVYYCLNATPKETLLELLQTATGVPDGEPQEVVRQALGKLIQMVGKAPDKAQALTGFLHGARKLKQLSVSDMLLEGLVARLLMFGAGPNTLLDDMHNLPGAQVQLFGLSDEPISVTFGASPLTLRRYKSREAHLPESVVVMLPGRALGSFSDYLVAPLGAGTLLCARAQDELAVVYLPTEGSA